MANFGVDWLDFANGPLPATIARELAAINPYPFEKADAAALPSEDALAESATLLYRALVNQGPKNAASPLRRYVSFAFLAGTKAISPELGAAFGKGGLQGTQDTDLGRFSPLSYATLKQSRRFDVELFSELISTIAIVNALRTLYGGEPAPASKRRGDAQLAKRLLAAVESGVPASFEPRQAARLQTLIAGNTGARHLGGLQG